MSHSTSENATDTALTERQRRGRRQALFVLAICAAPVVAAWLAFFVWQPASRMNYGELVETRPLPDAPLMSLEGKPFRVSDLKGRWVMVSIDGAACEQACQAKLTMMRQLRLTQGREMDRIERLWLIADDAQLDTLTIRNYDGMQFVRAAGSALLKEFPVPAGGSPHDHIYLVDPLGNLMMRYPKDADGSGIRKDLARLLRVSRVG